MDPDVVEIPPPIHQYPPRAKKHKKQVSNIFFFISFSIFYEPLFCFVLFSFFVLFLLWGVLNLFKVLIFIKILNMVFTFQP